MRVRIQGRQPLKGTYRVGGNSNAAMALIAASMLTDAPVTLLNVPDSVSVGVMLEIGASLGLGMDSPDVKDGKITLQSKQTIRRALEREQTDAMGGILLFAAPILARRKLARLTIDYAISRIAPHLSALSDLGCSVTVDGNLVEIKAEPWDKAEIVLTQTSVTATAIVAMLAASLGRTTTVMNAASEPHIVDLLKLLMAMGAPVDGIGSNLITIHGRGGAEDLRGAKAEVSPDHIEAASVAAIAALSGGKLTIEGTHRRDLRLIAKTYERLGLNLHLDEDSVFVPTHDRFVIQTRDEDVDVSVESAPWPGFPSDLIAMATVIATQARGTILIHEKLFNNRMLFVDRLTSMGAQIVLCDPHRAIVVGPTPLQGDYVDNPDVRTGLAVLGAAFGANGETVIDGAEAFARTFDHVLDKLALAGAQIKQGEV